ncbi:hypothetical protein AB0F81_26660, partial [Actinoplanes sp. NPDC024001]
MEDEHADRTTARDVEPFWAEDPTKPTGVVQVEPGVFRPSGPQAPAQRTPPPGPQAPAQRTPPPGPQAPA